MYELVKCASHYSVRLVVTSGKVGVGSFSHRRRNCEYSDMCTVNVSAQLAFGIHVLRRYTGQSTANLTEYAMLVDK